LDIWNPGGLPHQPLYARAPAGHWLE
jgi:hypothetical protein